MTYKLPAVSVPDATNSVKGIIKLAQDIGGSAALPTVVSLTGSGGSVSIASTGNIITWATATTAPGIKQTDNTTNSATAQSLTIQAQNATGTSALGGDLYLTSGTGTALAGGSVIIQNGGVTNATFTVSLMQLSLAQVRWVSTVSPLLNQSNNTTNSATGATFSIKAQTATGTTSTGGSINITSGTGTSSSGTVVLQIGNTDALTLSSTRALQLNAYTAGILQTDSSGNVTAGTLGPTSITAGATNTILWSNGTVNSFTATPIIATSLQVGTSGGGIIGVGGTPTTNKLYLNSAATPTVGQVLIQANSLGAMGAYVISADNMGITFDSEYLSSAYTARSSTSILFVKNASRLSIYGDSGLTTGNTFSPTSRASFDPATGNWRFGDNALGAQRLDVSGSVIISSKIAVGTATVPPNGQATVIGELFQNYGAGTNGGALRIASNSNQAFIGSNQYFNASIKYNSTGGASTISFDTTTTSTAGSISFQTAPSGTIDTTATFTTKLTLTQAGLLRIGDATVPADQLELKGPNFSWDSTAASPAIYQKDVATNSATGSALTIQAQNATGTTSTGGKIQIKSGTGTTTPGTIDFYHGSTLAVSLLNTSNETRFSLGSTVSGMRFLANTGTSQFITLAVAGTTPLGLYFDADAINFRTGAGAVKGFWNNTGLRIGDSISATDQLELLGPNISWDKTATTPKLYQKDNTTNSATATSLTLNAQNATGTTSTGGLLVLASGTGTSTNGAVQIKVGSTTKITVADTTTTLTTGNLTFSSSVSPLSSVTISQADNTTNSASANGLILNAQNATGTSATGGTLFLFSGTGTLAGGNISINGGNATTTGGNVTINTGQGSTNGKIILKIGSTTTATLNDTGLRVGDSAVAAESLSVSARMFMTNSSAPSTPGGGATVFTEGGYLKYIDSNGFIVTL